MAFHLVDSQSLSWFCRIGIADKKFKKFALNKNIKAISATAWQMINTDLLGFVKQEKIEKGRKVRVDCTCFEGGFASKDNLKEAKLRHIKDVCFAKKRGLKRSTCAAACAALGPVSSPASSG